MATTPRERLLTLENAHLRVVVDEQTSAIDSIIEKATGREWVNGESVVGFNAYIYDQYGSSGAGVNHLSNKLSVSDRLELLASRTLAKPSVLVERVDDPVEQRLVYEYAADGVESVRVTLRLRHDEPRLVIENRIAKPSTRIKESGYFAFPFAAEEPIVRFEVSGGVTGDALSHIPGAPQHMRAVRNWVSIADGKDAVAWATKDAPLVQHGTITVPYAPFPASTSPREHSTLFSWVHNNVWDTNFPIEQGFTATFSYSIGVRSVQTQSVAGLAIATAVALVHPLSSAEAHGSTSAGWADMPQESFVSIDDDRVRLVTMTQGGTRDQSVLRLQSFADEEIVVRISFDRELSDAVRVSYLGDPAGELERNGAVVILRLTPFEVCAVRVTRA